MYDAFGTLVELVLRHELQHTETMRQCMARGGLLPPGEPPDLPTTGPHAGPAGARTPTFRNRGLPQRRQLFAGLRLAADPLPAAG